jgi:hypothetical protein
MSRIATHSDTWAEVSAWASSELAKSRSQLESEAATQEQSIALRARIKLLKKLLELPNRAASTVEPEVAFGIDAPVS